MPLAPEIAAFGDGSHNLGATGITVDGGGFGAFPGSLWIYENSDRTGAADELVVGDWTDIELTGVEIGVTLNNVAGTRWLFLQREDLAWSNGFSFALEGEAPPLVLRPGGVLVDLLYPTVELEFQTELEQGVLVELAYTAVEVELPSEVPL